MYIIHFHGAEERGILRNLRKKGNCGALFFCAFAHKTQKFSSAMKFSHRLFQKAATSRARSSCRAPQSAKSHNGAFLLRLLLQKKKRELTHMRSMCVGVAETGGEAYIFCFGCWRDFNSCFYIKNTFLLSYFSVTKSTKSHLRTFPP